MAHVSNKVLAEVYEAINDAIDMLTTPAKSSPLVKKARMLLIAQIHKLNRVAYSGPYKD